MKTTVVITTFNEEKSIGKLLTSLLNQAQKPSEIVIIDSKSNDKTVNIIRHFQKKDKRIKLLVQKCSRSQGRNLGVELAKNEIIAMTDSGCVANKNWLKKITEPFRNREVEVVAGFYKMVAKNPMQKAFSIFLGVVPSDFDINFLPSTRSIAFRKGVWENVGGFPESLPDTAEDTVFNHKLIKNSVNISRVKDAIVEWGMPDSLNDFAKKVYLYAKGDAKSKIWWHSSKGFASHNIKILLIFVRYLAGLVLLVLAFKYLLLWPVLILGLILYTFWAFRKVFITASKKTLSESRRDELNAEFERKRKSSFAYMSSSFRGNSALQGGEDVIKFRDIRAGFWGVILQFISDFAVMAGFFSGFFKKDV